MNLEGRETFIVRSWQVESLGLNWKEKRLTSHRYEKFLRRQVIIQVKIAGLAACGKIKREMALCIQLGQIAAKETSLTQAICEMIQ